MACVPFEIANSIYQEGLRRVETTPEPDGQKFPIGSMVLVGKLPGYMKHFPGEGKTAIVLYTYAHAYGGRDNDLYCLDILGEGSVSWYPEELLSIIDPDTFPRGE